MLELLVGVAVLCLVVWLIFYVLGQIPMPAVVRTVLTAVIGLILLVYLLNYVGFLGHIALPR